MDYEVSGCIQRVYDVVGLFFGDPKVDSKGYRYCGRWGHRDCGRCWQHCDKVGCYCDTPEPARTRLRKEFAERERLRIEMWGE